ncbi:hypothetical protein, partial [Nostoc sp. CALU 1950]|uniref:hypothetical protein n=1 Tax=Nostoc sp. CALU 1950 TaxID=3104321 RepID=UPI003EC0E2C9
GKNGNIYELYITKGGSWKFANLSQIAGGASEAVGGISGYDSKTFNSKQVAYVGKNGNIYELYITKGGSWKYADLSQLVGGAPAAVSGISGYDSQVFNSKQVAYIGKNGNIYELYTTKDGNWKYANLSQLVGGAPAAVGGITGYDSQVFNSKQVAYVGTDGNIYELYITKDGNWKYANLSQLVGGAPAAVGRIIGYDSQVFNSKQVAYVGKDGNIYELYTTKDGNWKYANLSQIAGGAPRAVSVISSYDSKTFNSKQVAYVGTDGNIYELYITKGGNWKYANLSQITSESLRN